MTDINEQLIRKIMQGKNLNEIEQLTGMSRKQIYERLKILKTQGYIFDRQYCYNGQIYYKLGEVLQDKKASTTIVTSKSENTFKAVLISDMHFCSGLERLDAVDAVYNYCKKQNINVIINAGDVIEGNCSINGRTLGKELIENLESQVKYLIDNYPVDKDILNFVCLGNHDASVLKNIGLDVGETLINNRHDIVPIGYGLGLLNIKSDIIVVKHEMKEQKDSGPMYKLVLKGHSHKMKVTNSDTFVTVSIPNLSDNLPSAIEMIIDFQQGCINNVLLNQLIFVNKSMIKMNEINISSLVAKLKINEMAKMNEMQNDMGLGYQNKKTYGGHKRK